MSNGRTSFFNFPELSPASKAVTLRVAIRDSRRDDVPTGTSEVGKVWQRLEFLFNEVCVSEFNSTRFIYCKVYWASLPVERADPKDIVLYLVPSRSSSLIRIHHPVLFFESQERLDANPGLLAGGLTAIPGDADPAVLSEAYADSPLNAEPEWLANTLFHECYHNKLAKGNEVHSMGSGYVGRIGGFLQHELPHEAKLPLMRADKEVMARAIGLDRKQRVKL